MVRGDLIFMFVFIGPIKVHKETDGPGARQTFHQRKIKTRQNEEPHNPGAEDFPKTSQQSFK